MTRDLRPRDRLPPFNPLHPRFRSDPYPFYERYRREEPVHWNGNPDHTGPGAWYLFRYAEVVAALREPKLGRQTSRFLPPEPLFGLFDRWMLFRNPPDHTRLRALVSKAFTPMVVERLQPSIQQVADFLLDQVQADGAMDALLHYASPLPIIVIADLLGIPAIDREQFRKWSIDLVVAIDLSATKETLKLATQAAQELTEFLRQIVALRRKHPQNDLISALIVAEAEGDKLDEEELLSMCILLLGAGHETSVNLIGNGIHSLLRHEDQFTKLRDSPALIETAVEELLRYDSPVQMTFREAFSDLEIAGKTIRAGEQIGVLFGAANRDPEQFPDPNRLDISRTGPRHCAFSMGIHFCLGAPLARLEAQIAFQTLLRRMPEMKLQATPLEWREGILFHGLKELPVTW